MKKVSRPDNTYREIRWRSGEQYRGPTIDQTERSFVYAVAFPRRAICIAEDSVVEFVLIHETSLLFNGVCE
jgi:hypothetical protein